MLTSREQRVAGKNKEKSFSTVERRFGLTGGSSAAIIAGLGASGSLLCLPALVSEKVGFPVTDNFLIFGAMGRYAQ